jgi:hypothetical protein
VEGMLCEVGGGFVVGGKVGDGMATGKEKNEDGLVGGDVGSGGTGWRGDNVGMSFVRGNECVLVADLTGKRPVRSAKSQSERGRARTWAVSGVVSRPPAVSEGITSHCGSSSL